MPTFQLLPLFPGSMITLTGLLWSHAGSSDLHRGWVGAATPRHQHPEPFLQQWEFLPPQSWACSHFHTVPQYGPHHRGHCTVPAHPGKARVAPCWVAITTKPRLHRPQTQGHLGSTEAAWVGHGLWVVSWAWPREAADGGAQPPELRVRSIWFEQELISKCRFTSGYV